MSRHGEAAVKIDERAPGPAPALEVRGLRMRYGSHDVLHGIDLEVGRGEVVTLLGPNGAGKTTTIEILEGFRTRSAGKVQVLSADPASAGEAWRARLGIVLQSWRDHAKWRVRDLLVQLGRYYRPYGTAERPRPRNPDDLLDEVGLREHARAVVATLSGGQRRRLDVAVGLVGHPELLFLDEPTAGFDPQARAEFHDLIRHLSRSEDTSILLTTHDLDEAEKLADRIVLLAGGQVVAEGTTDDLAHRFAREDEVRYRLDGQRHVRHVTDSTGYVRELFARHGAAVTDLEVRRARLEDTYLAMVREHETAKHETAEGASTGGTP